MFLLNRKLNNELIIFSHIPKTAGTSLRQAIASNYEPNFVFNLYHTDDLKKKAYDFIEDLNTLIDSKHNKSETSKLPRVIVGHVGFGVHEYLHKLDRKVIYLTLLRDPIERTISYYFHARLYFHNSLGDAARSLSLYEFIDRKLSIEVDNMQTRFISGIGWQSIMLGLGSSVEYGNCSENMLKTAKQNLEKHYVFGLQDRFKVSLDHFQKRFDWKQSKPLKLNVIQHKQKKNDLSQKTIKCIEEHNMLDVELYEFSKKMFSKKTKGRYEQK